MEEGVTPNRRGLRQDIVVQALRLMQRDVSQFSVEAGVNDAEELERRTCSLLVDAENVVLTACAPGYEAPMGPLSETPARPRFIQTATFMTLMGIGTMTTEALESLVKARLVVSSGGADGK
jgi:hypothetical protein